MKKVAIIDDNYYLTDNLQNLLVIKNFDVKIFKTRKTAEIGLVNFNPDIIICDITLPDGNGEQIIKNLRTNSFFDLVPIIILTGTPNLDKDELLNLGVYKFLLKPVPFELLHRAINKALTKRDKYIQEKKISHHIKNILNRLAIKI